MKKFLFLGLLILVANYALAQTTADEHKWTATVKVVDENGLPVAKADVKVGYFTNNDTVEIEGITDTNGIFVASHTTSTFNYVEYKLAFDVEREGYYGTRSSCDLGLPYDEKKWNPTVPLVLKKAVKPIAMCAKKYVMGLKLPELNKPIAFDLMVGDWVGPYGKGITSDVIFEQNYTNISSREYFSKITVSFPKSGDGIQIYTIPDTEVGSGLRSPHEAPTEGYQPELTRETSAKPGQPSKFEYDPNRIYLFRVRTVLDHDGNVVSAHYGKIYGDFMQFSYYLNPTPNDRNIEFDPKQNLIHDLRSFQQVSAP